MLNQGEHNQFGKLDHSTSTTSNVNSGSYSEKSLNYNTGPRMPNCQIQGKQLKAGINENYPEPFSSLIIDISNSPENTSNSSEILESVSTINQTHRNVEGYGSQKQGLTNRGQSQYVQLDDTIQRGGMSLRSSNAQEKRYVIDINQRCPTTLCPQVIFSCCKHG